MNIVIIPLLVTLNKFFLLQKSRGRALYVVLRKVPC